MQGVTMRSTRPVGLAIGFALLVSTQALMAGESASSRQAGGPGERTGNRPPPQATLRGRPYRGLFQPDPTTLPSPRQTTPLPDASPPRVVCGMTLIPIDRTVDPKIHVEPPQRQTR